MELGIGVGLIIRSRYTKWQSRRGEESLFGYVIRNPFYCGKVFIAKYKDEDAHFVKGQCEPLISEVLFYQAQYVLDGKRGATGQK